MSFRATLSALRRERGRIVSAGLSVLCLGAAAFVTPAVPARPAAGGPVPGGRLSEDAVAALPAAARRLLADASWLLAVQHYGNRRLADSAGFPRLAALVENALRLDPGLRPAAVAGSLLLAGPRPLGAAEPRRADRILRAWTDRHPQDFEAVLVRALLHAWHLRNPEQGARILQAAEARGGAPPWFTAVAARSLAEAGSREAARNLWRTFRARTSDPRMRANARTHLLQLDALDRSDRLGRVVAEFEHERGRRPGGWEELVAAGLLEGVPVDPAGVAFVLGGDGIPRVAPGSPLAGHPGR